MQSTIFFVGDDPYCIFDPDIRLLNQEFLEGLDPGFFDYAADAHLLTDDEKRASVALKLTLHHGLETFFSLVGALLQAPDCVFAWVPKCTTATLRTVVERITAEDGTLRVRLNLPSIGWKPVAQAVFAPYMPGTDKQAETIEGFAKLWAGLAHEFLEPVHAEEYNSLKHGFRVKSGGFAIEVGPLTPDGKPPEEMHLLGKSDYGSSFMIVDSVTGQKRDKSLRVRKTYVNWSLEKTVLLCKAVSWSLLNVTSALRIANGAKAVDCQYVRPVDSEDFLRAWQHSPGVTNMAWGPTVPSDRKLSTTKEQILAAVEKRATALQKIPDK